MDFKKTLNIPQTTFEMKANLNIKEPKIQNFWLEKNIYQKILEKNKNNKSFLLHDGPPYANGNIHIGHALNKTLKDIVVRQKNLSGFYAPFIPGWDTHGLPIEHAMLKNNPNSKNESVIQQRKNCYEYALQQIENQKKQFSRIGLLTDFKKIYRTLDHEFEIEQLKLFLTLVQKELIYRDKKPVYWSWSSQSALAEAEIEYKTSIDKSIFVKFKANENNVLPNNTYFLVWTTTPWTLPANLAIAINPKLNYLLISYKNENFILLDSLLETLISKFSWDKSQVSIVKSILPKELEKLTYFNPINENNDGIIILADYVSAIDGTGLVHNAPGFGSDDYLACKKYGINPYSPIDNFGKYDESINNKELVGVFYNDANALIIEKLKATNSLIYLEEISHRVACDWRTKKPVIYRSTFQWFINLNKISNDVINSLKNDVKSPFQKNTNRMIEMINNRSEWCISRQRIWGVPIPIIYFNDEPILDKDLIKNIIDILDKNGVDVWFEWPVEKFLTSKYTSSDFPVEKFRKEKDIMDVWFDSGSSHQMFKIWGLNYPADIYLEGSDQYRGWFNSSLITGVIQNGIAPYKAILQHGFTLDEQGLKMSKSIGNVVDPLKIFDIYGADIFRLWVASCEYSEDQRFGENIIKQITEVYRRIRNTLFKYSLSIISDFNENEIVSEFNIEDKLILDKLNAILKEINQLYLEYKFNEIVKIVNNFTIELSSWYFDLIKDEIYCGESNSLRKKQIQTVVYKILKNLLIAMAPIIPHTTEEAYQLLPFKKYESVHLEDWLEISENNYLTCKEKESFKNFFELKDEIYNALEVARQSNIIKKSNMAIVIINQNLTNFDLNTLKQYLNVAEVIIDNNIDNVLIKPTEFIRCERCWNYFPNKIIINNEVCPRCNKIINNYEK